MAVNKNKQKQASSVVLPQLQFAVLCDGATAPDQRGKISLVGIFDRFLRIGIIPHFSLVLGWKNGKGKFSRKVRFLDPDLKQIFETPEMEIKLEHETSGAREILNIDGINLQKTGVYWIEIILEKETVLSIPIAAGEEKTS